jgi:EAL domain-containing protein (putative c-di-GMP-specific phosphodiesterase class I)
VGISIDDFGTGYSSLAYLKRYPIDKLKIDRSFVADTPGHSDDVAIVTAIIQMGRSLQLQTVAEGVETQAQIDLLAGLGCDLIQGFVVAMPMAGMATREWLAERV